MFNIALKTAFWFFVKSVLLRTIVATIVSLRFAVVRGDVVLSREMRTSLLSIILRLERTKFAKTVW